MSKESNNKLRASSFITAGIISYIIGLVASFMIDYKGAFDGDIIPDIFIATTTLIVFGILFGVYILTKLLRFDVNKVGYNSDNRGVGKTKEGKKLSQYADNR